jgi:hypothetical protein
MVEASLGIPTDYAEKLRWQTAVMFGEAVIVEPWDGVGEATMAKPIRHERGLLGGCDDHVGGET